MVGFRQDLRSDRGEWLVVKDWMGGRVGTQMRLRCPKLKSEKGLILALGGFQKEESPAREVVTFLASSLRE